MCFNYAIMVYQNLGSNDHELLRFELENQYFQSLLKENKWVFKSNNLASLEKLNLDIEESVERRRSHLKKQEEKLKGLIDTVLRYENNIKIKEERRKRLINNNEEKLKIIMNKIDY